MSKVPMVGIAFTRLKLFVNDCDSETPEIVASTARYIESALYTKEINGTEYSANIKMLKDETDRFKNNCYCTKK